MRERLSALPVSELREIAKANGIKSVTTLRKQQLIDMIIETAERKDAESNSVEKSGEEAIKVSKKEISKDETVEKTQLKKAQSMKKTVQSVRKKVQIMQKKELRTQEKEQNMQKEKIRISDMKKKNQKVEEENIDV